jgi:hypothetical protein
MKLSVKWFDGTYPSFNLEIASGEGKEPFLTVKGCRIQSGKDGEFVSGPSTKGKNDKYWNHTFMSKEFSAVVLKIAKAAQPETAKPAPKPETKSATAKNGGFDSFEDDVPF